MEGLGSLLLFAILFYIMMRFGCGAHMIHGRHERHGDHGSHGNEVNHLDPVCGMKVDQNKGYGKMHAGRLYRFCSKGCLEKFDDDPEQYHNRQEDRS
jgi:YHS domain-containing protein